MIRYVLAFLLAALANDAEAQRIRDMSLSMEETLREPDITTDQEPYQTGGWPNQPDSFNTGNRRTYLPGPYMEGPVPDARGQSFMASYCGSDTSPIVKNRHYQNYSGCIESIKTKACEGFAALPEDTRETLDRAVECMFTDREEVTGYPKHSEECTGLEARQLKLAKKYWNSQETTYLILFLPDMVSNPMIFCQR